MTLCAPWVMYVCIRWCRCGAKHSFPHKCLPSCEQIWTAWQPTAAWNRLETRPLYSAIYVQHERQRPWDGEVKGVIQDKLFKETLKGWQKQGQTGGFKHMSNGHTYACCCWRFKRTEAPLNTACDCESGAVNRNRDMDTGRDTDRSGEEMDGWMG